MTKETLTPAPFQYVGRDFLASRKQALLADQMRLGKSMQAVMAADKIGAKKLFITCPASVKINWTKEFDKWSTVRRTCQVVSGRNAKINPAADVTIINYDLLPYEGIYEQLRLMHWDTAIVDEAHYLKGIESKRTEAMLIKKHGLLNNSDIIWSLTGTPVLNRPIELFPLLQGTAPWVIKPYNTYTTYAKHFCGGYWDGIQYVDRGATNTDELNRRLLSGFMLRRLRKDVLDEIPKEYQIIYIPQGSARVKQLIAQEFHWETEAASRLTGGFGEDPIATVRRELGEAMVPHALDHIDYMLTLENKIVVFAWHKSVIKALYASFVKSGYNPALIGGGMNPTQKDVSETKFREDPSCRVMLAQHISGGQGLDFCAAKDIVNVEQDWTPGVMDQSGDRCSGFNQKYAVLCQYLVFQNSLSEHMMRVVIDKKDTIEDIIEDNSTFSDLFH